jgi:chromosome segregation ATPase
LLTREVEGLQKELAQSLKSIEKKEQSAKENRETTSKLKRRLNHALSTISKLKNEAEARDKLIESFTKILLQKIGVEDDGGNGLDESTVDAEKMNLSMLEQSLKMSLAKDMKV